MSKELLEAIERLGDWLNKTEELAENLMNNLKEKFGKHRRFVEALNIVRGLRYTKVPYDILREELFNKEV